VEEGPGEGPDGVVGRVATRAITKGLDSA